MANGKCGVCGFVDTCREVAITAAGHGAAHTYYVQACKSCWNAFNAMLEAQAKHVQLHLGHGYSVLYGVPR